LGRPRKHDATVHRSISMPISVLQKTLDEADLMGVSWSEAVVVLVVLGLATKKTTKQALEHEVNGGGRNG